MSNQGNQLDALAPSQRAIQSEILVALRLIPIAQAVDFLKELLP